MECFIVAVISSKKMYLVLQYSLAHLLIALRVALIIRFYHFGNLSE